MSRYFLCWYQIWVANCWEATSKKKSHVYMIYDIWYIYILYIHISGQIIIFHQPRFPWNKGISLTKPPFGVRSCEVAIIWPDIYIPTTSSQKEKTSMWYVFFFTPINPCKQTLLKECWFTWLPSHKVTLRKCPKKIWRWYKNEFPPSCCKWIYPLATPTYNCG